MEEIQATETESVQVDGTTAPSSNAASAPAPPAAKAAESTEPSTTPTDTAKPAPVTAEEAPLHIEAALLTSDKPLTTSRLGEVLGGISGKLVEQAIASLNEVYAASNRSFRIEGVAGGWQMLTRPDFADTLAQLHRTRDQGKLTPAAMETLAIIAYKQPILRAEVEAIRGVASGEVIRSLMERHLVRIAGRSEDIGRPILYGTTKSFLELFGLANLKDLPKVEDLRAGGAAAKPPLGSDVADGADI